MSAKKSSKRLTRKRDLLIKFGMVNLTKVFKFLESSSLHSRSRLLITRIECGPCRLKRKISRPGHANATKIDGWVKYRTKYGKELA